MSEESTYGKVAVALLVGVCALSFGALFFRFAAPTHPLVMAAVRLLLSSILLSPFVVRGFAQGRIEARFVAYAVLGGVFYALHFGCWVWSLDLTTVAASVTLVTATPLLLAIWGALTGVDRPDRRLWASLFLAALGIATIGGFDLGHSQEALLGDALAFTGAAAMAGYMLTVRRLGIIDVLAFAGIATLVGGVLLSVSAAAVGVLEVPTNDALGWLVLAALIPQLIGHNMLTWSLRHAKPTTVGIATLGEPVGATLLAWVFIAELPGPMTAVGCLVTLSAVALAMRSRRAATMLRAPRTES